MNKILISPKARNHIRVFPMPGSCQGIPEDEGGRILWAKSEYERLAGSDRAVRLACFGGRRKGYLITAWDLDGVGYVAICIRNEFGTYNSTVYAGADPGDAKAIARFAKDNIDSLMADYKKQILDARDWLLAQPKEGHDA